MEYFYDGTLKLSKNVNEKYSIRKFKDGKTESAKIGALVTIAAGAMLSTATASAQETTENLTKVNQDISNTVDSFEKHVAKVKAENDKLVKEYTEKKAEVAKKNKENQDKYNKEVEEIKKEEENYKKHIKQVEENNLKLKKDYDTRLAKAKEDARKAYLEEQASIKKENEAREAKYKAEVAKIEKQNADSLKKWNEDVANTEKTNAELKAKYEQAVANRNKTNEDLKKKYDADLAKAQANAPIANQDAINAANAENAKRQADFDAKMKVYNEYANTFLRSTQHYKQNPDVEIRSAKRSYDNAFYSNRKDVFTSEAITRLQENNPDSGDGSAANPYRFRNLKLKDGRSVDVIFTVSYKNANRESFKRYATHVTKKSEVRESYKIVDSKTGQPANMTIPLAALVPLHGAIEMKVDKGSIAGLYGELPQLHDSSNQLQSKTQFITNSSKGFSINSETEYKRHDTVFTIFEGSEFSFVKSNSDLAEHKRDRYTAAMTAIGTSQETFREVKEIPSKPVLEKVTVPAPVKQTVSIPQPKYLAEVEKPNYAVAPEKPQGLPMPPKVSKVTDSAEPEYDKIKVDAPIYEVVKLRQPRKLTDVKAPEVLETPDAPKLADIPNRVDFEALTRSKSTIAENELFNPQGGSMLILKGSPIKQADILAKVTGVPNTLTKKIVSEVPSSTQVGTHKVIVEIGYPDGTKDTATVDVTIYEVSNTPKEGVPYPTVNAPSIPMNKLFNPKGNLLKVLKGSQITDADLFKSIANGPKQSDASFKVVIRPMTSEVGEAVATVEISYTDGTKTTVKIPVLVTEEALKVSLPKLDVNSLFNPEGGKLTVDKGATIADDDLFKQITGLPKDNKDYKLTIDSKPSTDKVGVFEAKIDVTYPDGTKDTVTIEVTIKEQTATPKEGDAFTKYDLPALAISDLFNPTGKDTTIKKGDSFVDDDVIKLITGLPKDAKDYSIKVLNKIPTDTVGVHEATVEITYSDGTKDTAKVKVAVIEQTATPKEGESFATTTKDALPIADLFNPNGNGLSVDKGAKLTDQDLFDKITGLPENKDDYKLEVLGKYNTDTPGVQKVDVKVTYPDGSTDIVSIELTVVEQANLLDNDQTPTVELDALAINHLFNPEGGTLSVDQNSEITENQIFETIKGLPENSEDYTLKLVSEIPSTEQAGKTEVTVDVIYSDGTTDTVTVLVEVKELSKPATESLPPVQEVVAQDVEEAITVEETEEAPVVEETPAPVQEAPAQETPAAYNPYEAKQTPNTGASSIALAGLVASTSAIAAAAALKKKKEKE